MASTCKNSWVTFGSVLQDNENSGTTSPPLWKTNNYGNLSPKSRSEAIERGQKELMEMVSKMPEGCYELSLRDIVEVQHQQEQERKVTKKTKRSSFEYKKKGIANRSGSLNGYNRGFLLKTVFPISWGGGSKKKKKNDSFRSNSVVSSSSRDGRVSPKPLLSEGSTRGRGGGGGDDKEWWVGRRFSESEGSSSGGFSSVHSGSSKSSGSSSSRCSSINSSRIRHGNGGCWCFTFKTKE